MHGKLAEFYHEYRDEIKVFFVFFILYASLTEDYYGANEGSRMALTFSIVDFLQFQIDHYIDYTFKIDYAEYKGHFYSDKAPGTSILAIPIYVVIKFLGVTDMAVRLFLISVFTSGLLSALICALLYRMTGYFTKNQMTRVLSTAAYGLGTMAFPFSTVFFGHQIATFFAFAAFFFLFLIKNEKISKGNLPLVGSLLGISFLMEYPQAIIVFILVIYFLTFDRKIRDLAKLCIPMALVVSAVFVYNMICFDSPFSFSYSKAGFYQADFKKGVYGITGLDKEILLNLTLRPARGLFVYSPILLFSLTGFLYSLRTKYKIESLACLVIFAGMLIFNASYVGWAGGWSFGPRYLIPMLPFMCLLLVFSFDSKLSRYLSIPFMLASVVIMTFGTFTNVSTGANYPLQDAFEIVFQNKYGGHVGERALYYKYLLSEKVPLEISISIVLAAVVVVLALTRGKSTAKETKKGKRAPALR